MSDFVASNGIRITRRGATFDIFASTGDNMLTGAPWLGTQDMQALREFFQAEADERLGRFRTADVPEYVVYPRRGLDGSITHCFVVHEMTGHGTDFKRGVRYEGDGNPYQRAARAYFDAHPEPKPWEAANYNEIWVLTGAGGLEIPWRRTADGEWESITPKPIRRRNVDLIKAGRRIWPDEVS